MTETVAPGQAERTPLLRSMGRGFLGRCPHCGAGRIFGNFLKVRPHCHVCDLELAHHRADDLPPYIVIFIVGHIVGYFLLETEMNYDVPLWFQLTFWPIVTLLGSLALLQPVKGAVVGLQYALGMHGFATLPVPGAATGPQGEERPHGPGDGHAADRAARFGPA